MLLMVPQKETLTSTVTIHTPLGLIARILTPGLPETFQRTSMLCTNSKAHQLSTPWMNSKVAPSILGEVL
jgi:hypothetical protein